MTRVEHLLFILAEECAEISQRVSKAARFGLYEVQPGQNLTNVERMVAEYNDLLAVAQMLDEEGHFVADPNTRAIEAKRDQVEEYLRLSKECGTLNEEP
jgi:NTP pyrophosphatase (non-canonical NTP hydrolase)